MKNLIFCTYRKLVAEYSIRAVVLVESKRIQKIQKVSTERHRRITGRT